MNKQPPIIFHFDIFKGEKSKNGKVKKIRSVGSAWFQNGSDFAEIKLKTFPQVKFYLLHETIQSEKDFMIATKRFGKNFTKRRWNIVGNGKILSDENQGLIELSWDLFSSTEIYLSIPTTHIFDSAKDQLDAASQTKAA